MHQLSFFTIADESYYSLTSNTWDVTSYDSDATTTDGTTYSYTTALDSVSHVSGVRRRKQRRGERNKFLFDGSSSVLSDFASMSLSESESSEAALPGGKVCLHLQTSHGRTEAEIKQVYQPLFDWIDSNGSFYEVTEEIGLPPQLRCSFNQRSGNHPKPVSVGVPSLAIVIFLKEDTILGTNRLDMASTVFDKPPWRFHHADNASNGKVNTGKNLSYYTAGPKDPLCALRQIHCGKQLVRFVRLTTAESWQDQVNLYSLLLGQHPEATKSDFCLFTVSTSADYDVQFALKMVPRTLKPLETPCATLGFRIGLVGDLVPLLPHMCVPISDTRWTTTDLDGNVLYLDTTKPSRDSDSGISTSFAWSDFPASRMKQSKKRLDSRQKQMNSSPRTSGRDSDAGSVITDLDAFMKSVLEPLTAASSRSTTPSVCEDPTRPAVKSVRFNSIVNCLKDFDYFSEAESEPVPEYTDTERCQSDIHLADAASGSGNDHTTTESGQSDPDPIYENCAVLTQDTTHTNSDFTVPPVFYSTDQGLSGFYI